MCAMSVHEPYAPLALAVRIIADVDVSHLLCIDRVATGPLIELRIDAIITWPCNIDRFPECVQGIRASRQSGYAGR